MVTPGELLAAAVEMSDGTTEVAWRNAVSRAYYAAFHHCRLLAEERVGLPEFGSPEDHATVARALDEIDRRAAEALRHLRRERNAADYRIATAFRQGRASAGCAMAARILQLG